MQITVFTLLALYTNTLFSKCAYSLEPLGELINHALLDRSPRDCDLVEILV